MSQENVEIAARWYEVATSKAELLAAMPRTMAFCHPEVEWTVPEDGTTYHGREGVRRRLEDWLESFEDYRYEVQRIVDCGEDQVLVVANEVARGAVSGADVRSTNYELLTIRGGMIVRIREFYDEGDALEAAGLREQGGQESYLGGTMISTIAVGTDGSGTATEAVRMAADLARRFSARLVLVSAFQGSEGAPVDRSSASVELQWAANTSAQVREILARSEADLRGEAIDCSTLVDEGDPAEVLVRLATECGADLLVIGSKGMHRRVLGSVPNTVTHKAPCSVLVVKTIQPRGIGARFFAFRRDDKADRMMACEERAGALEAAGLREQPWRVSLAAGNLHKQGRQHLSVLRERVGMRPFAQGGQAAIGTSSLGRLIDGNPPDSWEAWHFETS